MTKNYFNVMAFGLALGVLTAIGMFFLGLVAGPTGWGSDVVSLLSNAYVGYEATFVGSIVGAVWGFVDGFIGGIVFAWFYNKFVG